MTEETNWNDALAYSKLERCFGVFSSLVSLLQLLNVYDKLDYNLTMASLLAASSNISSDYKLL